MYTRPLGTTLPYWSLFSMFGSISFLLFRNEPFIVAVWVTFLFAVILLPAAFLQVH